MKPAAGKSSLSRFETLIAFPATRSSVRVGMGKYGVAHRVWQMERCRFLGMSPKKKPQARTKPTDTKPEEEFVSDVNRPSASESQPPKPKKKTEQPRRD